MGQSNDHGRKLTPKVKVDDLSKETLIELLRVYGRLYLSIDGFWFLSVKDKVNNDIAIDCDFWVWERQINREIKRIGKTLDIKGNDVEALFNILQMTPFTWNWEYEMEMKDANHGKLTIHKCRTLEALEKEGEGRDKTFCKTVEPTMMGFYAKTLNPQMRVNCLKIPPHQAKAQSCCIWEFILEGKAKWTSM